MTLREKQSLFARLQAELILWIFGKGWEVTLGEGYDDDGVGHMAGSLHYLKLALDINLFVKGKYVSGYSPEWQAIGDRWKELHPLCRWGGDFGSRDYNHISLEHGGRA